MYQQPSVTALLLPALLVLSSGLLISSPARAQFVAGSHTPDRIPLGIVRVGATVEASCRVHESGTDTSGIAIEVEPPPFARVKRTQLSVVTNGAMETFIVCDVFLSVNTQHEGDFSGPVKINVGKQKVEVPMTVKVAPREPGQIRLLVLESPFDRYSTDNAKVFDPWLDLVAAENLDVHYLEVDPNEPVLRDLYLSEFDVVLLAENGLCKAQESDIGKLTRYMNDGGRVVIFADQFFANTVVKANNIVVPFGLRMGDTQPRSFDTTEIRAADILDDPLTKEVRSLKIHRPSPIEVIDKTKARILVSALDFPGQGYLAVAEAGKGEVVLMGNSLWWNWIASEHEKGADNVLMLTNLLTKPRKQN